MDIAEQLAALLAEQREQSDTIAYLLDATDEVGANSVRAKRSAAVSSQQVEAETSGRSRRLARRTKRVLVGNRVVVRAV